MFDYLSNGALRRTIESDYAELRLCVRHGARKAALVLAGSIVEALLTDALLAVLPRDKSANAILSKRMGELIGLAKAEGIISERAETLSHVVRDYRNYVHAAVLVRDKAEIAGEDVDVADALVRMLAREIGNVRRNRLSLTARELVEKLEVDPHCMRLLDTLLADMETGELRQLVLVDLVQRHSELHPLDDDPFAGRLETCFRKALEHVPETVAVEVVARFVDRVKRGSHDAIVAYATSFFRAADVAYCAERDRLLMIRWLLNGGAALEQWRVPLLEGIASQLRADEVPMLVDAAATTIIVDASSIDNVETALSKETTALSPEHRRRAMDCMQRWIERVTRRDPESALLSIFSLLIAKIDPEAPDEEDKF